jgi:hypothetical protein
MQSTAAINCVLSATGAPATENTITADSFIVAYCFDPVSPSIGEHFRLHVQVCRKDGAPFRGTIKGMRRCHAMGMA